MMLRAAVLLLLLACLASGIDVDIVVPEYQVQGQDAYVCTTIELPDKPMKLVGVEPIAKQEVVHHILLFGCEQPFQMPTKGGKQPAWECGSTCAGGAEHILYGWGRNAPVLNLPQGVGFSVGPGSSIRYIVAQVHYLEQRPPADHSGVRLKLEEHAVPNAAGMLSYAAWFTIPPGKPHHLVENNCCYRGWQPLTTFAMRVHTHTLGRSVSMTRVARDGKGLEKLAAGDPQAPQGFNPVTHHVLWPGDKLTTTCDFDSSKQTSVVRAGATHTNEMCNLYMMVYSALPHLEMCSDGAGVVGDSSPGNIAPGSSVLPDPYPLFKPFDPTAKLGGGVYGAVTSVAQGPDGTVWVLTRGGRVWDGNTFDDTTHVMADKSLIPVPVVHQLHPETGKVLRSWGASTFSMPHMITVDRDGAVWVADTGLHQVLKFNDAGRLLLTLGQKFQPGSDKTHLCKPAHVVVMNNGHVMVSDGYCNSRVVRYDAQGKWHCQYELPPEQGGLPKAQIGKAGGEGMAVVHSIALQECDEALFVADREKMRVLQFNIKSHALEATYDMSFCGKVWALRPGPYGRTLALCWQEGTDAQLVDVVRGTENTWTLPDTANAWPHDFALGPAPLALTGAGDRLLALYIAPLCMAGCGPLQRYVVFPGDYQEPEEGTQPAAPVKPVLAHLAVGGGHHNHGQHAAAAAVDPAAQEPEQQEDKSAEEEEQEDEKADEEADKEAEKAEEEKEEEEKKQEVVAALTSKLSKVQDQVAHPSDPAAAKAAQANAFKTVHSPQGGKSGHGLATLIAVGLVCSVLGAFIAMFAYNTMQKYVSGDKGSSPAVVGIMGGPSASRYLAVPVSTTGRHHRGGRASSINDALAEQEMLERTTLLYNGATNGQRTQHSLPR